MDSDKYFRYLVIGLCQYEAIALITGKVPTLTSLDRKLRHCLAPVLIGGLAAHLIAPGMVGAVLRPIWSQTFAYGGEVPPR